MRTHELFCHVKQMSRSRGDSAIGAAAYRASEKLEDERTGVIHDYTGKTKVERSTLLVPENAPEWTKDRAACWNAVERKENRSNSTVAHELQLSYPIEFSEAHCRETEDFMAREIQKLCNNVVDYSYHTPSEHNRHTHFLFPTRSLDSTTKDGWTKTKFRDLSHDKTTMNGEPTTRGQQTILRFRAIAAEKMNEIARRDGLEIKIEHESFKKRGIDKEPTKHLGRYATRIERKGVQSKRGDLNREIKAGNDNYQQLKDQKEALTKEYEQQKQILDKQIKQETQKREENIITILARKHKNFEFHHKGVEEAKNALEKSRNVLHRATLLDKLTGKMRAYRDDFEAKQKNFDNARMRFRELASKKDIEDYRNRYFASTARKSLAELKAEAAQYTHEKKELTRLEFEFQSRTSNQRIMGAITGKTREQQDKIAQLKENTYNYEEKQRRQETEQQQHQFNTKENQTSNDNENLKEAFSQSNDNTPTVTDLEKEHIWEKYKGEKGHIREREGLER